MGLLKERTYRGENTMLFLWSGLDAQPAGYQPFIALPTHVALHHWCPRRLESLLGGRWLEASEISDLPQG